MGQALHAVRAEEPAAGDLMPGTGASTIDVIVHGPMFDGRARAILADGIKASQQAVGDEGVDRLLMEFDINFVNPTGYYASQVVTNWQKNDLSVNDSGVVYGPWLEGTSSRNQSSRFKGYASFRLVTQELQADVSAIVEPVIAPYIVRMSR